MHGLSWQSTAYEMHACLKLYSITNEALKATSCLNALLKNGYIVAILLQDVCSGKTS